MGGSLFEAGGKLVEGIRVGVLGLSFCIHPQKEKRKTTSTLQVDLPHIRGHANFLGTVKGRVQSDVGRQESHFAEACPQARPLGT